MINKTIKTNTGFFKANVQEDQSKQRFRIIFVYGNFLAQLYWWWENFQKKYAHFCYHPAQYYLLA